MEFDILVAGGDVVDGTGSPRSPLDVGIADGKVAAVDRIEGARARRVIDAKGKVVAPGFIDVHVHSELARLGGVDRFAGVLDGVTTELMSPDGFSWAPLEPDRLREMYAIALQADEDIPGSAGVQTFEQWRAHEIDKPVRRPELCFLALAGDEVVGYAKFSVTAARPKVATHDLTAVKRAWRGRGVARALKATQIGWAKRAGYKRLSTNNEERNAPIRRLNERFGYRPGPALILFRGPLA